MMILQHKSRENTNSNSIDLLVFEILIFKLISVYKFQNVPCALGFEVKHSQIFCRSFRTCIIILSMDITINYFGHNNDL